MTDGDPHHRKQRIRNTLEEIEKSEKVSDHNKQVVEDFKRYLESQNLSLDRISRYLYSLKRIVLNIDWKLDEPDKDKAIDLVGDINRSEYWNKEIADATKKEYLKLLRKLWDDWLDGQREDVDGEKLTDFFSVTEKKNYDSPEVLPKPAHVAEIVRNIPRARGRSFAMLLWTAARVGAVLGCRWKDIRLHSDIATVRFRDTKTGDDREVPAASAYPFLKRYKEQDPLGDNPEAFLFRPLNSTDPDEQLTYNGAKGIIERAAERADIAEHIKTNPHAWRKGRISELARKGFSEAQISKISGHIVGSEEIRVYARIATQDVESDIRRHAGLPVDSEDEEKDPLRPKKCPECGSLNRFLAEVCERDGCEQVLRETEIFQRYQQEKTERELRKKVIDRETEWSEERISEEAENLLEEIESTG